MVSSLGARAYLFHEGGSSAKCSAARTETDDRRRRALGWLRAKDKGIGSAFWICETLEIDRQWYPRGKLIREKKNISGTAAKQKRSSACFTKTLRYTPLRGKRE